MGYLDGFGVTIKKWLGPGTDSGRRVTTQYPEQTRPKPERFHGRHVLNRYDDGMEKCIGCELCAGVCPAKCIYVRGQDNDPDDPTSPGERFGFIYEINYLRCIHCDLCVEACPTEAITETKLFEFAFTNRADAIYTKDELLVGDDGRPQQLPWENWDGGFDPAADSSGWMRATSPSGDADFNGIVAWAGELGYGVRAPQGGGTIPTEVAAELEPAPAPALEEPVVEQHEADHSAPAPVAEEVDSTDGPAPMSLDADDAARPLLVDADPDIDVATETPADEPQPTEVRRAGMFDAPDAPEVDQGRGMFGRRRGRRDGTPSAPAASTSDPAPGATPDPVVEPGVPEDTSLADAQVAADLEHRFVDDDATPGGPADAERELVEPTDDVPTPEPATEETAEGASGDEPPRAGFFDAPDEPEPPAKGRRRRRGGR